MNSFISYQIIQIRGNKFNTINIVHIFIIQSNAFVYSKLIVINIFIIIITYRSQRNSRSEAPLQICLSFILFLTHSQINLLSANIMVHTLDGKQSQGFSLFKTFFRSKSVINPIFWGKRLVFLGKCNIFRVAYNISTMTNIKLSLSIYLSISISLPLIPISHVFVV